MSQEQLIAYYKNEYETLMAIGLQYGCEREQTKDTIQQLFLQFAEKHTDLDALSNPKAYIITSFKRKLIDQKRHTTRLLKNTLPIVRDISDDRIDLLIIEKEESAQRLKILATSYHQLPMRCQRIIYLKYMAGLTNEQIAEQTGLTIRSIYNNLSEGIKLLRTGISPKINVDKMKKTALGIVLVISGGWNLF